MAEKPKKRPRFWGYLRVSTRDQADNGHRLEADTRQMKLKFEADYAEKYDWGGLFFDKAQSAAKTKFRQRPEAVKLLGQVRAGDLVAVVRLDRGFRNQADCIVTLDHLRQMGVDFCMFSPPIDTTTAFGRAMCGIMAALAELEREWLSERTREGIRESREKGKYSGMPAGFRNANSKSRGGYAVLDEPQVRVMALILKWRLDGLSLREVAAALTEKEIEYSYKYGPQFQKGRTTTTWHWNAVRKREQSFLGILLKLESGRLKRPDWLPDEWMAMLDKARAAGAVKTPPPVASTRPAEARPSAPLSSA